MPVRYPSRAMRIDRRGNSLAADASIGEGLPASFISEWTQQLALYEQYWGWMDGNVWDQVDRYYVAQKGQDPPLLFPLQMNPIYNAALIHRNALFGEVPDTGVPMVTPIAIPKNKYGDAEEGVTVTQGARNDARFVSDLLELILYQSNARSAFLDAGFVSQALGGCVFKVAYEPYNRFLDPACPIALRQIEPEFFMPVFGLHDRWNLIEARIGRMIDGYEAREIYGMDELSVDGKVLYMEKWTRNRLEVRIDGKPAKVRVQNEWFPLDYNHNWGIVPVVYIPHELVGQFYGVPIVHQIGNLVKELNGRAADVGDAVRNSIERLYILSNAEVGDIKIKRLESGITVMATGREMSGTQAKSITDVRPPDLPRGTLEYLEFLRNATWHGANTPAVAYGEDEGSQRSALTLAFRMWPLTAHVRTERSMWTEALKVLFNIALTMLSSKQTEANANQAYKKRDGASSSTWQIKPQHLGHVLKMGWAPMVPRDQESEVNQLILRHQDRQISAETSMEKMNDIDDIQEELKKIREEDEETLKLEAKYQPQQGPGGQDRRQGALSDTQPPIARAETE